MHVTCRRPALTLLAEKQAQPAHAAATAAVLAAAAAARDRLGHVHVLQIENRHGVLLRVWFGMRCQLRVRNRGWLLHVLRIRLPRNGLPPLPSQWSRASRRAALVGQ